MSIYNCRISISTSNWWWSIISQKEEKNYEFKNKNVKTTHTHTQMVNEACKKESLSLTISLYCLRIKLFFSKKKTKYFKKCIFNLNLREKNLNIKRSREMRERANYNL